MCAELLRTTGRLLAVGPSPTPANWRSTATSVGVSRTCLRQFAVRTADLCCARAGGSPRAGRGPARRRRPSTWAPASSALCSRRSRCTAAGRSRSTRSSTCCGPTHRRRTSARRLQAYVARLRRALEPDRERRAPATILVTVGSGYALHVPADQLDAARFDRAVTEAASPARPAAGPVARTGIGAVPHRARRDSAPGSTTRWTLWRGEPYAELDEADAAVAERARLAELRLVALEDRAVVDLALGHHATVAAELEALTSAYPLRERLWALRALALTRSGPAGRRARRAARGTRACWPTSWASSRAPSCATCRRPCCGRTPRWSGWRRWRRARHAPPSTVDAGSGHAAGRAGTPGPVPRRGRRWPMVGRDGELAALVGAARRRRRRHARRSPRSSASPGIGKTRLADRAGGGGPGARRTRAGRSVLAGRRRAAAVAVAAVLARARPGPADGGAGARGRGRQFRAWEAIAAAVVDAARRADRCWCSSTTCTGPTRRRCGCCGCWSRRRDAPAAGAGDLAGPPGADRRARRRGRDAGPPARAADRARPG